jgi:hypothetical protein
MVGQRLARQPKATREKTQSRMNLQLVSRSVAINGTRFSALVRDGASAEEIIEKVARQHGGGVAKIYNQEFKAHEVVAVKVGENLIVKDDPTKVSKADFSQFKDPQSVKEAAIRASQESKGGIHFFLGESGIPVALGKDGGLAFPNAEELRLRGNTSTIHISLVDYNANPVTLDDLDKMYSKTGGIRMSSEAQQQMARPFYIGMDEIKQAHGGMRGEKLLLVDTSVLVLDKDTGDMMTMAEHAAGPEGFRKPGFDFFQIAPPMINQPLPMRSNFVDARSLQHTDLGPMQIPMDGSAVRVPYLFIKVFDGKVEDAVPISAPLEDLKKPKEQKLQKQPQLPAVMLRNNTKEPKSKKDIVKTEPEFTLRPVKTRKAQTEKVWMPLAEKPAVGTAILRRPSSAPPKMSKTPQQSHRTPAKPLRLKNRKIAKPKVKKRKKKPKKLKPQPSAKKRIPKTNLIKEKRKRKPKKQIKVAQPLASTIIKENKNPKKKKKPKTMKPQKPSVLKREKARKKKDKIKKAKALSRKKKKNMKSYFFKEMMGLYKKRTRRSAVRNSR